ncbi:MAG: hypothetical protein H9W81_08860 [Enterococcus sp.]|nr:hypothetical protein [Enterococcus sp.]
MMDTLMEALAENDFVVTEDSNDAVTYSKESRNGTEEFTLLLNENVVLHERYNGTNGSQIYSQRMPLKSVTHMSAILRVIK